MLVPAVTPVTTPEELIVATEVLLLVHVPPPVASPSEVVRPWHTVNAPVIAAGLGLIVTVTLPWVPQHPAEVRALK